MKNAKNSKNKISFKATLSKKNSKTLKPERINIHTLIKPKNNSSLFYKQNKTKMFYKQNELSIRNRSNNSSFKSNNSSIYNNSKKKYIINSLNSSFKSTYTSKKRKFKKHKKIKRINNNFKNNLKIKNTLESLNNIYIHSPNNINQKINKFLHYSSSVSFSNKSRNKHINYSNYSSSNKYIENISISDNSFSSETSYNSIEEYKKNKYFSKMKLNEIESDNLTKKEVGIISNDDEENNINSEENNNNYCNNNSLINQEDYSEEIEHILIDIYNKNISIINSQNIGSPVSKKLYEVSSIDKKKMKKNFKKQNDEKNLLVLKSLSDKIKCLIEKCKEKIYEIEDINKLYQQYQTDNNNNNININQKGYNSIGSSGLTTNSNSSSYYGSGSDDYNYYLKTNFLINNIQDETFCKDISHDLLTQLLNIKNTLKVSSKEIENIFKYSFKSLKTNDGKKAKINIELVLLEQFNKIILNDNLISTLLIQIKFIFSKNKEDYIVQIIDQLSQECLLHNNSMTKFDNLLNQNLGIINDEIEKNNLINENKKEIENNNEIKEINNNNDFLIDEMIDNTNIGQEIKNNPEFNNNLFNIGNNSFNDEEIIEEEEGNNILNEYMDLNEQNNNNENINIENNNENNNNENNNQENNEENNENNNEEYNEKNDEGSLSNINFENIDDLVKFINEDSDDKSSNKKHKKKNKKKKKKKISNSVEEKNNDLENNRNNNNINNLSIDDYINNEFDDEFIKKFKIDIIKTTVYNKNIIKMKPLIPNNYSFDKF